MSTTTPAPTFLVRPPGPAHDAFVALNEQSIAADIRVSELAKAYIEKNLGVGLLYVDFGWEEACDTPAVLGYRTTDEWDLDANGRNVKAGIGYESGSFTDIEDAVALLDNAYRLDIEQVSTLVHISARFRIHSNPGAPAFDTDRLDEAIRDAMQIRAETEVAAIAALRERAPLNITSMLLRQCLLHRFCFFNSAANGTGTHYDDDMINELDVYAEAIGYKPSQEALDAGMTPNGVDGFTLYAR